LVEVYEGEFEPGLKGLEDGPRTGNERGWGSTLLTTRIGGLAKIIVFPSQLLVFKADRDKLDGPDGINEKALP